MPSKCNCSLGSLLFYSRYYYKNTLSRYTISSSSHPALLCLLVCGTYHRPCLRVPQRQSAKSAHLICVSGWARCVCLTAAPLSVQAMNPSQNSLVCWPRGTMYFTNDLHSCESISGSYILTSMSSSIDSRRISIVIHLSRPRSTHARCPSH